jgi:hypothetical protein
MPQGCYELVEGRIDSRPADSLHPSLGLPSVRHALVDLLLGLADEGVEQVVQRIFADRLQFVGVLGVSRLRAVVVVALGTQRPRTRGPLRLAMGAAAIAGCRLRSSRVIAAPIACARQHAVGDKGLRYQFLRHDGSIEGCTRGGDDLGAQRAGRRGVDEAGVPRVLYAVHDGRVAVVGVGARRLALERVQRSVGAGTAADNLQRRRLRARCDVSRRGCQRPAACLAGLATRGRRGVVFYMVRYIPGSWTSLQERESSCTRAPRGQHKTTTARKRFDVKARPKYGTAEAGSVRHQAAWGVRFTVPRTVCEQL